MTERADQFEDRDLAEGVDSSEQKSDSAETTAPPQGTPAGGEAAPQATPSA